MLDDRLRRLAGVGGRGELALQAPGAAGAAAAAGARGRLLGPRLGRAAEQPALAVVDLGVAQDRELLRALDALGDDARADLAGERDGGAQHGLAAGVEIDAGDHAAAELEEVGAQLGDVLERREAGAGVVDRDERAARDPRPQPLAQLDGVLDRVLLGELDHEPRRQALGELEQPGVAERVGRDVDEQQPPGRRRAGLADRRPAGDLELVAHAEPAGGGERDVRRQRDEPRRRREAGQPLVADRLQIGEPDDRLEDRADRPGGEQLAEVVDRAGRRRTGGGAICHCLGHRPRGSNLRRPGRLSGRRMPSRGSRPWANPRPASGRSPVAATTRRPWPGERWKRGTPSMIRSMSLRSSTSLRSSALASWSSLVRWSEISFIAPRSASSERCCCSSSRSWRVRSETAPPSAETLREVIEVPIA